MTGDLTINKTNAILKIKADGSRYTSLVSDATGSDKTLHLPNQDGILATTGDISTKANIIRENIEIGPGASIEYSLPYAVGNAETFICTITSYHPANWSFDGFFNCGSMGIAVFQLGQSTHLSVVFKGSDNIIVISNTDAVYSAPLLFKLIY